jgi:murein L,D-transpeptidase YcbB/YkuD
MNHECLTIYKYPLCLLVFALMLAGCQQKMVPQSTAVIDHEKKTTDSVQAVEAVVTGVPVIINTSVYSIDEGISRLPIRDKYFRQLIQEKVRSFYSLNKFQTKWLEKNTTTYHYQAVMDAIQTSFAYGLRPNDYNIEKIQEQVALLYSTQEPQETAIYSLDVQITGMFFLFTTHLAEGRLTAPGGGGKIWMRTNGKQYDDVALLMAAADEKTLVAAINSLQPQHEQYLKLQSALKLYREYANAYQDQTQISIGSNEKIKPNDAHKVIPAVRKKLAVTDLKVDSTMLDSARYDEALVGAVKWFQQRHGLEPDGIIGTATIKFLNQTFAQKVSVLELNLERMRWESEQNYGDHYITVNIPEYKLRVINDNRSELEMKVIVGSEGTATPVFKDTLRYIVFSPTWAVPNSIIRDEIIPKLKRDSAAYSGKNYSFYKNGTIIDPSTETWTDDVNSYAYNIVQQPGRDNALGLVKFVMPNKMSIYLHDTPNHRLFSKSYRALSHGCVRLDDPDKLAAFLLKDYRGWDIEAVEKAMYSNKTQTVFLKRPYPVHLEYRTAWVDENGLVNFREDIYGHDKRQLAMLKAKEEQPMVSAN